MPELCQVECPHGALQITDDGVYISKCIHCESCLDMPKGCLSPNLLSIIKGGNNMSIRDKIDIGILVFRKIWLKTTLLIKRMIFGNPANWVNTSSTVLECGSKKQSLQQIICLMTWPPKLRLSVLMIFAFGQLS